MTLAAWLLRLRPSVRNAMAWDYADACINGTSVLERYATQRGRMWRQWRCV